MRYTHTVMNNENLVLYRSFERAYFIARENRFTLVLKRGHKRDNDIIRAYIPSTGRMEEFCVEGHPFFVTAFYSKKFRYRVVSTLYQGWNVLLDTAAVQRTVQKLLETNTDILPGIRMGTGYRVGAEKKIATSRFDFRIEKEGRMPAVVEIKTCTLCHNNTALFPDAPSARASSHIRALAALAKKRMRAYMVFVITNGSTRVFFPNFHTDPVFSSLAASEKGVRFTALRVPLSDPVTVDMSGIKHIPIDWNRVTADNADRGSYIAVLKNERPKTISVGSLGGIRFKKGYYVYVGSALGSLSRRVHRHGLKRKKLHWHIDYISPSHMSIEKTYLIRRGDRIESALVKRLEPHCATSVRGFGATDSSRPSHLLYFTEAPFDKRFFMDVILDFRTCTEHTGKTQ